jgi:hypothetical protein
MTIIGQLLLAYAICAIRATCAMITLYPPELVKENNCRLTKFLLLPTRQRISPGQWVGILT